MEPFKFEAEHPKWLDYYRWKVLATLSEEPLKYKLEGVNKGDFEYHWKTIEYTPLTKEIKVIGDIIEE